MRIDCPREQDVIDAVTSGRWPDRADDELRTHVGSCALCGEVAAIVAALQEDREATRLRAPLPPAGRVWWRAEMRARREAARHAVQPIGVALGLAIACAAGLAAALLQLAWTRLPKPLAFVAGVKSYLLVPEIELSLVILVCICAVVTPLAAYLLFSDQ